MITKDIHQKATFNASSKQVYDALLNAEKHTAFTGANAEIDPSENGKFSVYDGYCNGYTIKLVPNQKIVQAWHFEEEGWPSDHFSICTFLLEEKEDQCLLTFTQTSVPEHKVEALKVGWEEYYWKPLAAFL